MSFVTPAICDRRVFDKRGKWQSPNNDIAENIFYFVKEPLTITSQYVNGKEELAETLTITIFGGKPIAKEDTIVLEDGTKYKAIAVVVNYIESNVLVKDLLKPRVAETELVLE